MQQGTTRSRTLRAATVVAVAVAVAASITGCAPADDGFLTLGPTEIDDPECPWIRDIPVEELDDPVREPCVPVGSTLVFPDGERADVFAGSGGASSATDPDVWLVYSTVGDYGVIAARYGPGCADVTTWGPRGALEKVRAAFGQQWPCDPEG
ncbi:hypothetical protein [Clavibacter zhangzhiyongii]|uniref:Secreted protein n=1 Tax=Clavibacter zhangzhiyongii TaxID=2768071 RepID=A0A7L7Z2M0_9MICO|nr:hypothetical protein [Clavibacter zhangzhiyongii]QOD43895.1 hypothetical protein H9X71_00500 [Clavibacter zhangzhiyongii]